MTGGANLIDIMLSGRQRQEYVMNGFVYMKFKSICTCKAGTKLEGGSTHSKGTWQNFFGMLNARSILYHELGNNLRGYMYVTLTELYT